jgi:hypothetical protein
MRNDNITLKEATNELLETSIMKNVAIRTSKSFAHKLTIWLVRYILIISSMNESLKINLETILINIHGKNLKKILNITEKIFAKKHENNKSKNKSNNYIW